MQNQAQRQSSALSSGYGPALPPWSETNRAPEMMEGMVGATGSALQTETNEPLTPPEGTPMNYEIQAAPPVSDPNAPIIGSGRGYGPCHSGPLDLTAFDLAEISGVYAGTQVFANFEMRTFRGRL